MNDVSTSAIRAKDAVHKLETAFAVPQPSPVSPREWDHVFRCFIPSLSYRLVP